MLEQSKDFLRIAGGSSLLFSFWDEKETVVYHCLSGDTHTLNSVASVVVRALEESPVNSKDLSVLMARKLNYLDDDEFRTYIQDVIVELRKIGLVEIVE